MLTVLHGSLYFTGNDGSTGDELWKYDPATGVTTQVADINDGPDDAFSLVDVRSAILDGKLYFVADDGNGYELWSI